MLHKKIISKVTSRVILGNPKKAVFSITDECSMRCKMCYNWRLHDSEKSITPEIWKRAIKGLSQLKKDEMLLNFVGGEPFEKKWVLDVVKEASKYGLKTSLTTNASLIDEKKADEIRASGLNTLCISLDGLTPETHDYYRGIKGTHGKAMKALDMFSKKAGPELIIQTIIMDKNLGEIENLVNYVNEKKHINGIYFMSVMKPHHTNLPDNWYLNDKLGLWPKNKEKIVKVIDKLIEMKKNHSKIVNSELHLKSFKGFYLQPEKFIKSKDCDVMDFGIYISSLGDVSICSEKGIIGNIKHKNLKEIWYSYDTLKVKEKMKGCKKNCEFLVNCFYQDEK